MDEAFHEALALPSLSYNRTESLNDLFAAPIPTKNKAESTTELRFIDAIHQAIDVAMAKWPELVLMGQDIADYGGVFKATENMLEKYGEGRVRNTPLCESAIVGSAMGYAISGESQ